MFFSRIPLTSLVLVASLIGVFGVDDAQGAGDQADAVEIGGKGGKGAKGSDSGSSPISAKETSKSTPTAAPITGAGTTSAKVITIVVGSPVLNKSLVFTPNDIKAAPGDILQFQFSQINHTVTQSTFNAPCQPIQESDPQAAGLHSGFIAATANATTVQTFDVPVNDTKPMFIYCAQGPHCQLGMVMTVNAVGNESLAAYKALAAKATSNVPAKEFRGGVLGSIPAASAAKPPI